MANKEITEDNVTLDDIRESIPEETVPAEDVPADIPDEGAEDTSVSAETAVTETEEASEQEEAELPISDGDEPDNEDEQESDDDESEEEEAPRYKAKKRRKKRGTHVIFGVILSVVIISVSILAAVFILKCAKELFGIGKSDIEMVVEIPMDSSTADIAEQLFHEGIIAEPDLFRAFVRFKGADGTFIAGAHELSPQMDYSTIIEVLQESVADQRETADIVFPEGITLYAAAQKLEEKGVCDADEFIRTFNISEFGFDFEKKVKTSSMKFYRMEGYLFPDTYQFFLDEDPRVVAKKIYKNFEARITPDLYGRMDDLGMDLEEVLTLASIVQAEAPDTWNMKRVASVFYNRLNDPDNFPLLQSDATSNYVENIIKPNIEIKSQKMFDAYNTYEGAGLPPGPICNPGLDAINAVLYPAETDYYFFLSDDDGEFYYAETLEEHEQNAVEAGLM